MTHPPQPPTTGPLSPHHGVPPQGAMPSPGAPVASAPGKKPSKAPKILIIVGGAILALSVIIGVVVAVIGFGGVASGASEFEVYENGSGTVSAEEGDVIQLFAEAGTPVPQCMVDGPAVGEGTIQTSSFGDGERQWESFDSFTAGQAGEYTIDCGDTPVMVGPPVSIGGIFAGLGGILVAVFGGALGFLLLLIGVILLIVRNRKA